MIDSPDLCNDCVRLRPLVLSDAESLHAIYSEPATMRFYDKPVSQSLDDSRALVRKMLQACQAGNGFRWAILPTSENVVVGSIGFHGWERGPATAFLSYEIAPAHRGRGLSVSAGTLVIQFGFTAMGLRRILALVDYDNAASLVIVRRLGFEMDSHSAEISAGNFPSRCQFSLSCQLPPTDRRE